MSGWTISLLLMYLAIIVTNLILSFSYVTGLYLLMCFAIIMLPSAIILFAGRILSKNLFIHDKGMFKVGKIKAKICSISKVKKWKDKIPVGGHVAGFRLNKLQNPSDDAYLSRYVYESCFAEWLHLSIALWGLLGAVIVALINPSLFFKMALPISLVFMYQNLTSVVIQWYVRPRIVRLKERTETRSLQKIH